MPCSWFVIKILSSPVAAVSLGQQIASHSSDRFHAEGLWGQLSSLVLCFTSLLLLLLDGNYWMFNVWIASHSNAFEFSRWDWKVQLTRGNACLPTLTEVSVLTFQLLADASVSCVGLKTTARTQSKALSLSLDPILLFGDKSILLKRRAFISSPRQMMYWRTENACHW